MTNESEDYNHPMRVVWRDLLRKHLIVTQIGTEEQQREDLFEFIRKYERLYYEILKDDIQVRSS